MPDEEFRFYAPAEAIAQSTNPKFAEVQTENGESWTGVQINDEWFYVVDFKTGEPAPYPPPPGEYCADPSQPVGGVGEPAPSMPDPLTVYTIYLNPIDIAREPGADIYVMRKFLIGPGTVTPEPQSVETAATLEEIRDLIPWSCVRFPREPNDDPNIVESWF